MDALEGDDAGGLLATVWRALAPADGPEGAEGPEGAGGPGAGPPPPLVLLGGPGPRPGNPAAGASAFLGRVLRYAERRGAGPVPYVRISAEQMRRDYGVRPLSLTIGAQLEGAGGVRESVPGGGGVTEETDGGPTGGAVSEAVGTTAGAVPAPGDGPSPRARARARAGARARTGAGARSRPWPRARLRDFPLMRDIVELALEEGPFAADPLRLRDHCYARRTRLARHTGRLRRPRRGGGADAGRSGSARWRLVHALPLWWFGHRCTRRFLRPGSWYARWPGSAGARSADGFFDNVGRLVRSRHIDGDRSPRTRQILRAVAAEAYEELLLRALLADLGRAARSWPAPRLPFRRTRRARRDRRGAPRLLLLLELPAAGADSRHSPGALFLRKYRAAARDTGCASVVVIAAGPAGSAGEEPEAIAEPADLPRLLDAPCAPRGERGEGRCLPVLYARLPGGGPGTGFPPLPAPAAPAPAASVRHLPAPGAPAPVRRRPPHDH